MKPPSQRRLDHPLAGLFPAPRMKRLLPWAVAAVVLVVSFLGYLLHAPPFKVVGATNGRTAKLVMVRNNLMELATAADSYLQQHPNQTVVRSDELQRWLPGVLDLKSVAGEHYDSLVIARDWQKISVVLADGTAVEWKRRSP